MSLTTKRALCAGTGAALLLLLLSSTTLPSSSRLHPSSWTNSSSSSSTTSSTTTSSSDPRLKFTTPSILSTFVYDSASAPSLEYRRHLEQTTSTRAQLEHSKTMTFDHIYVLSLPGRVDRRQQMTRLANALGLELTFVDASLKDEPFIRWIAERAKEVRVQRLEHIVSLPGLSSCARGEEKLTDALFGVGRSRERRTCRWT